LFLEGTLLIAVHEAYCGQDAIRRVKYFVIKLQIGDNNCFTKKLIADVVYVWRAMVMNH